MQATAAHEVNTVRADAVGAGAESPNAAAKPITASTDQTPIAPASIAITGQPSDRSAATEGSSIASQVIAAVFTIHVGHGSTRHDTPW